MVFQKSSLLLNFMDSPLGDPRANKFAVGGAGGDSELNKHQLINLGIEKDLYSKSQM